MVINILHANPKVEILIFHPTIIVIKKNVGKEWIMGEGIECGSWCEKKTKEIEMKNIGIK